MISGKHCKKILVLLLFLVTPFVTWSQPGGGGPGGGGDPDNNPVPITGLEILLAAGAAFGVRSIVKKRKE